MCQVCAVEFLWNKTHLPDGRANRENNVALTNGGPPWAGNPIWREHSPITYAANWRTPILLSVGEKDFRVPIGEGLQLFTTLQRLGVPSRMVYLPDEGHWINRPANGALWYREFVAWMDRWVKS